MSAEGPGFELVRLVFHEATPSPGLAAWLAEEGIGLAFCNGNRLFLLGAGDAGDVSLAECQFGTCTALAVASPDRIYLATRYQIWRLENALPPGQRTPDGHDRLFIPQSAWTTGLLGVHQLVLDGEGRPLFVNGRFSCLATVHERLNFTPVWVPPFISALQPEDRCRLTGVALVDGAPAYVTSASRSDVKDGWREHRRTGGVVLTMAGDVVTTGLSLPASPVVAGGHLWLENGGAGEVGRVDLSPGSDGRFEAVGVVPGLARGLALVGRYAVVGVSRPKPGETFDDLPVRDRLGRGGEPPRCGVAVVDTATGRIEHSLYLDAVAPDVTDVAVLPGTRAPAAVAFQGDEVQEWVTVPCPP